MKRGRRAAGRLWGQAGLDVPRPRIRTVTKIEGAPGASGAAFRGQPLIELPRPELRGLAPLQGRQRDDPYAQTARDMRIVNYFHELAHTAQRGVEEDGPLADALIEGIADTWAQRTARQRGRSVRDLGSYPQERRLVRQLYTPRQLRDLLHNMSMRPPEG